MYKVACFKELLYLYLFLRFPEVFFATFILICSYFISGFSAANKKYMYNIFLFNFTFKCNFKCNYHVYDFFP